MTNLTEEQRDAIEWAADEAYSHAKCRAFEPTLEARWRVLSDLFTASSADDAQPASGVDDARDAARYRWLRKQRSYVWHEFADMSISRTDELIDAAIAQRARET